MFNREDIIKEAKSWIGTNFRYQGRVKKNQNNNGGVDCLGLIFGVCDKLGYKYNNRLLSSYDNIVYDKNPNYSILMDKFSKFFIPKDKKNINKGDILLVNVSQNQFHLMFYNCKTVIHASAVGRKVVEHSINNLNIYSVYSMFNI